VWVRVHWGSIGAPSPSRFVTSRANLRVLKPDEIEDYLCILKDKLQQAV
jgi:hypothetical protein